MFKWIKDILSYRTGRGYEEGSTVLPKVRNIPPMPKVKPTKGNDISEPVISFLNTVRKHPKRFTVDSDCGNYCVQVLMNIKHYKAYKIWDKKLKAGWYIKGSRYLMSNSTFVYKFTVDGPEFYGHAFFLTSDEKEYLIKEISSIMNYRVDRKAKLDKIRTDRRIRDTRNKLKELYK